MVLFENVTIGQHVDVLLDNIIYSGTVKYKGSLVTQKGDWVGLYMYEPVGSHNGLYKGRQYFHCPDGHGLFVRSNRLRFRPTNRRLFNNYHPVKKSPSIEDLLFTAHVESDPHECNPSFKPTCITNHYDEQARQQFPENYAKFGELPQHHKSHLISRMKPASTSFHEYSNKPTKPRKIFGDETRSKSTHKIYATHPREHMVAYPIERDSRYDCTCGKHNRYNSRASSGCDTRKVKCLHEDQLNDTGRSDTYDLYGRDFMTSPSIPSIHMPYTCQQKRASLGWDGFHYTREMSAPYGRDSIKFSQWNDISA